MSLRKDIADDRSLREMEFKEVRKSVPVIEEYIELVAAVQTARENLKTNPNTQPTRTDLTPSPEIQPLTPSQIAELDDWVAQVDKK